MTFTTRGSLVLLAMALAAAPGAADITLSFTGTLASPDTIAEFMIVLPVAGTVTLQTYGFGGGTNAANKVIPPGGTDPFLAIFSGTGSTATIVTDASANPYGTSLDITNYASFVGCGPAGAPVIGGSPVCGDITMSPTLGAGIYTIVLSDGQNFANAIFDNGTLDEGFTDLTGGNFCNLSINGVDCPNTSGAYALDVTAPDGTTVVPEPSAAALLGTVITALGITYAQRRASATQFKPTT